jgi:hypothetical protein
VKFPERQIYLRTTLRHVHVYYSTATCILYSNVNTIICIHVHLQMLQISVKRCTCTFVEDVIVEELMYSSHTLQINVYSTHFLLVCILITVQIYKKTFFTITNNKLKVNYNSCKTKRDSHFLLFTFHILSVRV